MLLTFKKHFPFLSKSGDKIETGFVDKIIWGPKAHTFRVGNRWKPGDKIHFWSGNPRNVKQSPFAFNPSVVRVDWWMDSENGKVLPCTDLMRGGFHGCPSFRFIPIVAAVELAQIWIHTGDLQVFILADKDGIKYEQLKQAKLGEFCVKDGFWSYNEAARFFQFEGEARKVPAFKGQIIHWSEKTVYNPQTAQIFRP